MRKILISWMFFAGCEADAPAPGHTDAAADALPLDAAPPDGAAVDSGGGVDMGRFDCARAWASPRLSVRSATRPDAPGLRIDLEYGLEGGAHITLTAIEAEQRVLPSDGPFSVETHAGAWVELQDARGGVLYTRSVFELIGESLEAPPPPGDGGFVRVDRCPEAGFIRLRHLPNDPAAVDVVLFQEVIDGRSGGPTVALARFALP